MADELTQREKTDESLNRIQNFDPETLRRNDDFGNKMDFSEVVEPARRIIDMFKRLPPSALDDFTDGQLSTIQWQTDAIFDYFDQILKFDPKQNDPSVRGILIDQVKSSYSSTFESLYSLISYGVSKTQDFAHHEEKVNSAIRQFTDTGNELVTQMEEKDKIAQKILSNLRNISAEKGVSQQATCFKKEAEKHESAADRWQIITVLVVLGFVACALLSPGVFNNLYHELVQSDDGITLSVIQIVTSKILVFAALGYLLILCGKTYLSHRHNAVVNKHRQNALLTYTTLVEAASTDENSDVILNHAANCIFSPQDSGYVSGGDKNINLPPINTIRRVSEGVEE